MNIFKEIYDYRQMIFSLVRKDLRGRYKGSVLGFLWTFINPLLQLVVYSFVFSTVLRFGDIEKYYVFLFVALIPWMFFSACLTNGAGAIISSKDIIAKIYFPREVIPIAYVTSCFVNMLLSFVIIFAVLIVSGIGLNFIALLYLPLIMILEYFLALGITLITSSVTVYFRDLEHILSIVGMAWMYLTPVMYPGEFIPDEYRAIFDLNPMAHIITAYRDILYYSKPPHMGTLVSAALLALICMVVGSVVFFVLKRHFAEEF